MATASRWVTPLWLSKYCKRLILMNDKQITERGWQVKRLGSRLPWAAGPIRPAEVSEGLCAAVLARENVLEDVNYLKVSPNHFIVEIHPQNYTRNYQPIEGRILQQWRDRLIAHLATTNSRQGRQEYRFGGGLQLTIRPVPDLKPDQARILCRVQPDEPGETPLLPARLELLDGSRSWVLRPGVMTIGREAHCDIALDFPAVQEKRLVSAQHAYLQCRAGRYLLFDGAPNGKPSTNGTYVNSQRVPQGGYLLQPDDLILLAAIKPGEPRLDTPGVAALRFKLE